MLNPVIGTVKYLCFFCLGIYSFCYSIVMYFFPIYDMIREFCLMCMMQKRERRISMDGGLWPDRNNACKTSVLSPRSPPAQPPTPTLPTLYIALLSTMPHYRWNIPHSYVIYNAPMHFSSTPKCFASPCVTVLHSCASVCTWGHFMSKMPARHLFCHTFHRLVCNWYV